jgi:hypothetical protein
MRMRCCERMMDKHVYRCGAHDTVMRGDDLSLLKIQTIEFRASLLIE